MQVPRDSVRFWATLVNKTQPATKMALAIHKAVILDTVDSGLRMRSNSGFNAIEIKGLAKGETGISVFGVSAQDMMNACSGPEETVTIGIDVSENVMEVSGDKSDYRIALEDVSDFQFPDDSTFEDVGTLPKKELLSVLTLAEPFLSDDVNAPHLMGVMFDGAKAYAMDRTYAISINLEHGVFPVPVNFIPSSIIEVLNAGGEDTAPVSISISDEWVRFSAGPAKVYSHRWALQGEYKTSEIDNEIAAVESNKGRVKLETQSIKDALSRVAFFTTEGLIVLNASRTSITLSAYRRDKISAKIPLVGSANIIDPIEMILETRHLKVLSDVCGPTAELRVAGSEDSVYCKFGNAEYFAIPAAKN